MERDERISQMINDRIKCEDPIIQCCFQITVPNLPTDTLVNNEYIKTLIAILEKYGVNWTCVDSVAGSFNLNRDWIETSDIPCYVEYCGVYPVKWGINDIVTLEELENSGKVIIQVLRHTENGQYIPNY